MISYQLAVICIMATIIFTVLIIGFIEEIAKRLKEKKRYVKNLENENKILKRQIESARFISKLKGRDLDV